MKFQALGGGGGDWGTTTFKFLGGEGGGGVVVGKDCGYAAREPPKGNTGSTCTFLCHQRSSSSVVRVPDASLPPELSGESI